MVMSNQCHVRGVLSNLWLSFSLLTNSDTLHKFTFKMGSFGHYDGLEFPTCDSLLQQMLFQTLITLAANHSMTNIHLSNAFLVHAFATDIGRGHPILANFLNFSF